ncbi:MAG TPA: hypothetical protein VGC40_06575 [Paenirhodobacter sp.]
MRPTIKSGLLTGLLMGATLGVSLPALAQGAPDPRGPGGWPQINLKSFDTDGDGNVSLAEIQNQRKAEAAALDANGDGKLSAEEMVNDQINRMRPAIEARVQARIKALDVDGDGLLSAAELAMAPMPDRMFERIDADGDGTITGGEMQAAHEKMMQRMQDHGPMKDDQGPRSDRHGRDQDPHDGPAGKPGDRPAPDAAN